MNAISGSFVVNAGTIIGVAGGNGAITYAGNINNTAGRSVDISGRTGNTVTFSGDITDTGTGIIVQNNTSGTTTFSGASKSLNTGANPAVTLTSNNGHTINFSNGGLAITTTSGTGFNATGGATAINVSGTGNIISSGTGTAVNLNSINGALSFTSISANGAADGIVLNTTTGSFAVTGDGSAALGSNSSGGTIQNTTSHGISLTQAQNVSLGNIKVFNAANSGIWGTLVVNFTLANSTIDGVNTAHTSSDGNVAFNLNGGGATENNVSGTVTITGNVLNNSYQAGIDIYNYAGTISALTIMGNHFTSSTSAANSFGSAISIYANRNNAGANAASITAGSISSNTVANFPNGAGIQVLGGNTAAGPAVSICSLANPLLIQDNIITGAGAGTSGLGSNGAQVTVGHNTTGYFTIGSLGHSNIITNVRGNGIAASLFGTGTMKATIAYNFINANNTANSPGINTGADSATSSANTPTLYLDIHNNTVTNSTGNSILSTIRSVDGTGTIYIQSNNVAKPTTASSDGIRVDAGNGTESTGATICLKISANNSEGSSNGSGTIKFPGIGIRQQHAAGLPVSTFRINGLSPTPANDSQMETYVSGQNSGSIAGTFGTDGTASISSGATYTASTCTIP